ncbi:MAG TPA: C45 family autoproteolytic acyltransferase/hydrolase [Acidobacteriota bacterium]|nr:C45 family autoproteolytic acyltransferase/hydrolase [Acidobacteriota bacterium]
MKFLIFVCSLIIGTTMMLTPAQAFGSGQDAPARVANGHKPVTKGNLKVVVLEGSPYNRGLIHGRTLKKEIGEILQLWKADVEQTYKMKADEFTARFLKTTNFIPAIQKWTPELLDEVKGISDGSGIDFNTILMLQLGDEQWAQGPDVTAEHCTSISVNKRGPNPTFVAQNMDIEPFYQGYQTLLHIKDSQTSVESFVLTTPGLIGLNGLNNHSVAITCNTLLQLESSHDGLPVAFIVRGVLEKTSFDLAVEFVKGIHHASGQNYIIGGTEKAVGIECSAKKTSQYVTDAGPGITYHTNHPLANDNYSTRYLERLKKLNRTVAEGAYYCYRFESLEKRFKHRSEVVGVDVIKSALSSRDSKISPISNESTFGCTIMVLSDKPELHIAPGQPHRTAFRRFRFTESSAGTPQTN